MGLSSKCLSEVNVARFNWQSILGQSKADIFDSVIMPRNTDSSAVNRMSQSGIKSHNICYGKDRVDKDTRIALCCNIIREITNIGHLAIQIYNKMAIKLEQKEVIQIGTKFAEWNYNIDIKEIEY